MFAIVAVCALGFEYGCGSTHPPATGIILALATDFPDDRCGDSRDVVAMASGNHKFSLNGIETMDLSGDIRGIFRLRAEKILYLNAAEDASFADFVELMDQGNMALDGGIIAVLTKRVSASAARRGCFRLLIPFKPRPLPRWK